MSPVQVPLGRNGSSARVALIDAADAELIQGNHWFFAGGYARTYKAVDGHRAMHRLIMRAASGLVVDHINGDGLDNRRSNLRVCTHAQNIANCRSLNGRRFKGVVPVGGDRWAAVITRSKRPCKLGVFSDILDAARAYDVAAREQFGEFARLNLPGPGERAFADGGKAWWRS